MNLLVVFGIHFIGTEIFVAVFRRELLDLIRGHFLGWTVIKAEVIARYLVLE